MFARLDQWYDVGITYYETDSTMLKKTHKRHGFTLVELLVVIAITSLLSTVIITYSSTGRSQVALHVEQAEIAQTILRAKSLTISTYNQPVIPCGYGVYFDYSNAIYELFSYDVPDCSAITSIIPGERDVVSTSSITQSLVLDNTLPDAIENVLFLPPNPDTLIWRVGSISATPSGVIYIGTSDGTADLEVSVNEAGQISFE